MVGRSLVTDWAARGDTLIAWAGDLTSMGAGHMGVGMAGAHDFDAVIDEPDSTAGETSLQVAPDAPELEIDLRFGDTQIVLDGAEVALAPRSSVSEGALPADTSAPPDPSAESVLDSALTGGPGSELLKRIMSRTGVDRGGSLVYLGMKRTADLVVSGLLSLLLLPIYILVAVLVWTTSKGPVLYRQERIGQNGSTYTMLKFRTMSVDADQRIEEMEDLAAAGEVHPGSGPAFKAPDDPRITRVGKFIRRTGLDELPQLLNIIGGTMSIIGPRPLVTKEVDALAPADAELRHQARPGVSCIWQVMRTPEMSFEERIALDLLYVRRRSVTLDLVLLFMTPVAILRGENPH